MSLEHFWRENERLKIQLSRYKEESDGLKKQNSKKLEELSWTKAELLESQGMPSFVKKDNDRLSML
jgi:hypothetical protein